MGLATLIFVSLASIADDPANDDNVTNEADSKQQISTSELISRVKQQFARTKARGTIWLRTQKMMDELNAVSMLPDDADAKQQLRVLAQRIEHDCKLIDNQTALERARYLLTTLRASSANSMSLDAVRSMIKAADGEAALLLVEDLVAQLNAAK